MVVLEQVDDVFVLRSKSEGTWKALPADRPSPHDFAAKAVAATSGQVIVGGWRIVGGRIVGTVVTTGVTTQARRVIDLGADLPGDSYVQDVTVLNGMLLAVVTSPIPGEAGGARTILFRSDDGLAWSLLGDVSGAGRFLLEPHVVAANSGIFVLGTVASDAGTDDSDSPVVDSIDQGRTWSAFGAGWPPGAVIHTAQESGDTMAFGGCARTAAQRLQATVWLVSAKGDPVGEGHPLGESSAESCVADLALVSGSLIAVGTAGGQAQIWSVDGTDNSTLPTAGLPRSQVAAAASDTQGLVLGGSVSTTSAIGLPDVRESAVIWERLPSP